MNALLMQVRSCYVLLCDNTTPKPDALEKWFIIVSHISVG